MLWIGSPTSTATIAKWNFKKADATTIAAGAKWLQLPRQALADSLEIDEYVEYLVRYTQDLISYIVLKHKPSIRAQAW